MTAGTVAIVGIIADRSPEVRRMAALQRLARKAATPGERRSVMAALILDNAITCGGSKDNTALVQALVAWEHPGRTVA
jgi:hypothetical protein